VPAHAAEQFEQTCLTQVFPPARRQRHDLLLTKTTMFSPAYLVKACVPVYRGVQHPGEFMITFPRAFHAGFSHGFSCAESVNFALPDWLPMGALSSKMYRELSHMPVIPHDQLLFILARQVLSGHRADTIAMLQPQLSMLLADESRLRALHREAGYHFAPVASSEEDRSLYCARCRHACYASYVRCACDEKRGFCSCLRHCAEVACDKCKKVTVYERVSLAEMETMLAAVRQAGVCLPF